MAKKPNPDPIALETIDIEENSVFEVTPGDMPVKKSRKKLFIVLAIVVVLLAAAGTVAYLYFSQKPAAAPSTSITQPKPTEVAEDKLTAEELVALSRAAVTGDAKQTLPDTDGNPYKIFRAPLFKPADYDFSVDADVDYGFGSYGTKSTMTADLAAIQKVLTDNKLVETVLQQGTATEMYAAHYQSDDIICALGNQLPYNEPDTSLNFSVVIGCADKSSYLKNAQALKPYFEVYAAQSEYDTTKVAMNTLAVKQSKTPGYSTASVSIGGSEYGSVGGFAGLFYTTPDKVLHYFTGTQSGLQCTSFNTDDLKKAYLGEECYDDNNNTTTVKL